MRDGECCCYDVVPQDPWDVLGRVAIVSPLACGCPALRRLLYFHPLFQSFSLAIEFLAVFFSNEALHQNFERIDASKLLEIRHFQLHWPVLTADLHALLSIDFQVVYFDNTCKPVQYLIKYKYYVFLLRKPLYHVDKSHRYIQ